MIKLLIYKKMKILQGMGLYQNINYQTTLFVPSNNTMFILTKRHTMHHQNIALQSHF